MTHDEQRDEQIRQAYANGESRQAIATRLGCSYRTVAYVIDGRSYGKSNGPIRYAIFGNGPLKGHRRPIRGAAEDMLKIRRGDHTYHYERKGRLASSEIEYLFAGTTTCAQR